MWEASSHMVFPKVLHKPKKEPDKNEIHFCPAPFYLSIFPILLPLRLAKPAKQQRNPCGNAQQNHPGRIVPQQYSPGRKEIGHVERKQPDSKQFPCIRPLQQPGPLQGKSQYRQRHGHQERRAPCSHKSRKKALGIQQILQPRLMKRRPGPSTGSHRYQQNNQCFHVLLLFPESLGSINNLTYNTILYYRFYHRASKSAATGQLPFPEKAGFPAPPKGDGNPAFVLPY